MHIFVKIPFQSSMLHRQIFFPSLPLLFEWQITVLIENHIKSIERLLLFFSFARKTKQKGIENFRG